MKVYLWSMTFYTFTESASYKEDNTNEIKFQYINKKNMYLKKISKKQQNPSKYTSLIRDYRNICT